MSGLVWLEKEIKLSELKEYELNPRRISDVAFQRLVSSIKEHGYHARMLVDLDNTIVGGHARRKALKVAGFKDSDPVKVLVPNRKLTNSEYKRLNVLDNGTFGEFDMDMLSIEFDPPELIELGVPEFYFKDLEDFEESADKTQGEDKQEDAMVTCPSCNHEFKK